MGPFSIHSNYRIHPKVCKSGTLKYYMLSSMCECYVFLNIFFYYFTIQAILLESPTRQLTLGDIYKWFTTNFKYFRTTSNLTWKVKIHTNVCFCSFSHCTGCTSSKMISKISFVLWHPVCTYFTIYFCISWALLYFSSK